MPWVPGPYALPHVAKRDLPALWRALDAAGLATPNVNLITDIIACPGLDYCTLANARAIPVAQAIARKFADPERAEQIGERVHLVGSGIARRRADRLQRYHGDRIALNLVRED